MSRLKLHIFLIVLWFFGFYNVERLIAPINLASFVYGLAAAYALLIMLVPMVNRVHLGWVFLASLAPYVGLKILFQSPMVGASLPLTVTEVVSIAITVYLAYRVANQLNGLNKEILRLSLGPTSLAALPFNYAQADCYREIRRARHYNRPAAVLSIAPTLESINLSIDRFSMETERDLIRQYIVARTADMLRKDLKETDIVTMRNQHFLVLLPETEGKHMEGIIQRLKDSAYQQLGIRLVIGASTFPGEAVTFESLVEYAEKRMKMPAAREAAASSLPELVTETSPAVENLPDTGMRKADIAR